MTKDTRLVSFIQPDTQTGHPQSSPLEQGSPTSGIEGLMIWSGADAIRIEIKCTINVMHLNHPQTIPTLPRSMEKFCSRNWSLVPKRLQTAALEDDIPHTPFRSPDCNTTTTLLGSQVLHRRTLSQQVLSCSSTQCRSNWGKVRRPCFSWDLLFSRACKLRAGDSQPGWVWSQPGHFLAVWPWVSFFISVPSVSWCAHLKNGDSNSTCFIRHYKE